MRLAAVTIASVLSLTVPLSAQESPAEESGEGMSLMERGARLLMEGLMKEMEPALEGLEELGPTFRSFAQEMGPALAEILKEVEDWSAYHPPERLPNGDIIIRRKTPDKAPEPPQEMDQIDI